VRVDGRIAGRCGQGSAPVRVTLPEARNGCEPLPRPAPSCCNQDQHSRSHLLPRAGEVNVPSSLQPPANAPRSTNVENRAVNWSQQLLPGQLEHRQRQHRGSIPDLLSIPPEIALAGVRGGPSLPFAPPGRTEETGDTLKLSVPHLPRRGDGQPAAVRYLVPQPKVLPGRADQRGHAHSRKSC
jgi:hypothetical protein